MKECGKQCHISSLQANHAKRNECDIFANDNRNTTKNETTLITQREECVEAEVNSLENIENSWDNFRKNKSDDVKNELKKRNLNEFDNVANKKMKLEINDNIQLGKFDQ